MALDLSYVVVTDAWETIRDLSACLARQSVADRVELVVVGPPGIDVPPVPGLGSVQVVEHRNYRSVAARIAGLRAAAADVVAVGETHVLPEPGWAQAVVAACDGGADVVFPRMANANPGTLSWAAFTMDYGRYAVPNDGSVPVPSYNACFRKSVLLSLEPLEELLIPGPNFDGAIRRRGARIVAPNDARLAHLNVGAPGPWVRERLLGGLLVAAHRSRHWSRTRRAAYAVASPLIAAVLFARAMGPCRQVAGLGPLPALAVACALYATGEAAGYVGLAQARHEDAMAEFEIHKRAFLAGSSGR